MTPEQRAEKLNFALTYEPRMDDPEAEAFIASQIREAVEEATQDFKFMGYGAEELRRFITIAESNDIPKRLAEYETGIANEAMRISKIACREARAEAYEEAAKICDKAQKNFEGIHWICEGLAGEIRARAMEVCGE